MILRKKILYLQLNYSRIRSKSFCINCVRYKTTTEAKNKTYSHTILVPKTNFPMRSNAAQKELILEVAKFSELYNWQRQHLTGPEYVLHDGPPYANGDLHMGHAVNKIIKDISNRSQLLQGNKVHYVPGWDCHGLPIELKALQKAKKGKQEVTGPVQLRQTARNFALETVKRQKDSFIKWGVMADWDKSYLTLNKGYVKNQLNLFNKMYEKGFVFRALKPVYWSPSSRTALAEAELEYDQNYRSKEVYVTFPVENVPEALRDVVASSNLKALIWTTTPWTLVANRAICYNPQLKYSIIQIAGKCKDDLYLVASELVKELGNTLGAELKTILEFDGEILKTATYRHKLLATSFPFLSGPHVSAAKGTGLVHTAPAHGPDDFLVALKHGMDVKCNVDESGRYIQIDQSLDGLYVLKEGQDAVIGQFGDDVIHHGTYVHSYPLDWRTKKPVILRASQQWFIDTEKLKSKALEALESIELLPSTNAEQNRQGFKMQLAKRPYWCISRQRAWGVPIPALYMGDEAIVDPRITSNLCNLIDKEGEDAWWTCDVTELMPKEILHERKWDNKEISKGKDIMDIWLDSGLSWSTLGSQAKLYSEGVDQFTGWFQASLLTSLALTGKAPYKSIFVHGFVVDEKKRKMSKSIGNVIDPTTIMNGGKDKSQPAYGVDTLRWWVASHSTQHSQIVISKNLLDDCQAEVIRIRNILKYLLSVITDLDKDLFYEKPQLNYLDEYIVKESYEFSKAIYESFDNFKYNHACQSILYFISNKVSGLYCHCVKDRLYCSGKESNERLSAQLAVHTILTHMCKALGPILPHLVEEVWSYHPLKEAPFFMTRDIPILNPKIQNGDLMDAILEIKREMCLLTKNEVLKKFVLKINVKNDMYDKLVHLNSSDGTYDSVLSEIFEVSEVILTCDDGLDKEWAIQTELTNNSQCIRCRKYNALECSDKCLRCENVLLGLLM